MSNVTSTISANSCFLSHATEDKPVVREVAERLKESGIEVWFDEEQIVAGQSIPTEIEKGLNKATHMAVFFSNAESKSGWVAKERNVAVYSMLSEKGKGKQVIPVILEEDAPISPLLSDVLQIRKGRDSYQIFEEIRRAILGTGAKV